MQKNTDLVYLLREKLKQYKLDGYLIPSVDEFQCEYVPDHLNRLKFITGFSGSNGLALITLNEAIFFTDGRYLLQATKELSSKFKIQNIATLYEINAIGRIGYDTKLHTKLNIAQYKNLNLVECNNLVDSIWQDKPKAKLSQIFKYPLKFAGESFISKRNKIQAYLQEKSLDSLIITDPNCICWLLNIRAHDIDYNPILLSYLIFHQCSKIEIFSSAKFKEENVDNYPLEEFSNRLKLIANKKVQLDQTSASAWVSNHFKDPIFKEDPCLIAKACKNNIEIKQARRIHQIDGVALCKLLHWLEKNYAYETEMSVAEKLLDFRKMNGHFIYPSFPTIAGFKEHGAIIHYRADENSDKPLANGLLLLDSGGQYFGGTTDITRTIALGKPTHEQKLNFTLVLKGHIALAKAKFPKGTSGSDLDSLARQYLWQHGKDYAHGTGHGVGNCLNVHEGPQRISKLGTYPLSPGMIISNEPGFYKTNEYGIRIENLMLVVKSSDNYLSMETLTLVPIEKKLILRKLLSNEEKEWLNSYHQKIYNKISPSLNSKEKAWLKLKTASL